ncbi:MAG: hypothetical protein KGJ02_00915 [Verrucomicrobiota bacterium]|nr:hypothetical protein [Verrucomicrobiota bacterium]
MKHAEKMINHAEDRLREAEEEAEVILCSAQQLAEEMLLQVATLLSKNLTQ